MAAGTYLNAGAKVRRINELRKTFVRKYVFLRRFIDLKQLSSVPDEAANDSFFLMKIITESFGVSGIIVYFCSEITIKNDEESPEMDGYCAIGTRIACGNAGRVAIYPTHPELGREESRECGQRKDGDGHQRGTRTPAIPARPAVGGLSHAPSERLFAAMQRHHSRHTQPGGGRAAMAAVEKAGYEYAGVIA